MRFMHAKEIFHGQLTPSNLLLDSQWRVRIADFGTSKYAHDERFPVGGNGIAHYLPPERFEGEGPSASNDVYAFGLILCEIITGVPVYPPHMPPLAILRQIANRTMPLTPDSIGPEICRLIRDCWLGEREERPSFEQLSAHWKT
jgi:serine/threonine protein kinase